MAVIGLDKDGNQVVLRKGQTMAEHVESIKEDNIKKGIKNPECVKDILKTKQSMKENEEEK